MKKPTSLLSAGACVLFLSAASSHGQDLLYSSDFAPENGHDATTYAPGWDPDALFDWSSGAHPEVVWHNTDVAGTPVAAVGSNGYFKENKRETAAGSEFSFASDVFSTGGATEVTMEFKIKMNTSFANSTGRLDFRLMELGDGGNYLTETWQTLFLNEALIDSSGVEGGNNDMAINSVSLADENGWTTVSLSRELQNQDTTNAVLRFAPWTDSFEGSYGVDDVSVIPEPSTYALFGGLLALGLCVARRRLGRNAAAKV